jgi:hypothetical protein
MYRERLIEIVEIGYDRLRAKINGGRIKVDNEASLQLHLASLLKTIGEMYEYRDEVFSIELEKAIVAPDGETFGKSRTKKAKIDIWLGLENARTGERGSCAIELKFLKKGNQGEPNNRYKLFADIQNLEQYGGVSDVGFFIFATDHPHYVNQPTYSDDTKDFDLRDGKTYTAGTVLTYRTPGAAAPFDKPITLANSYEFHWDELDGGLHFMKLQVDPVRAG